MSMPPNYNQTQRSYTRNSVQSAELWWEPTPSDANPNDGVYRIKMPYTPQLIDFLKKYIPADKRDWDPDLKIWSFNEEYFPAFKFMFEKMYPYGRIRDKADVEAELLEQRQREAQWAAEAARNAQHAPVTKRGALPLVVAIQSFRDLTGLPAVVGLPPQPTELEATYKVTRKAYLSAVRKYHPDVVGGDAVKAAQLNVVWSQIEKEVFNK